MNAKIRRLNRRNGQIISFIWSDLPLEVVDLGIKRQKLRWVWDGFVWDLRLENYERGDDGPQNLEFWAERVGSSAYYQGVRDA